MKSARRPKAVEDHSSYHLEASALRIMTPLRSVDRKPLIAVKRSRRYRESDGVMCCASASCSACGAPPLWEKALIVHRATNSAL